MNRYSLKLDRFAVGTILASLAALALAAPTLAQQQWPMFRFDPLRMGCNRFETQIDPGSTETDDTGVSYMPFTLQFPRRHVAASIATQLVVDNEATTGDFAASPGSGAAWSVVTPQATWNQQGNNWLIAPAVDIAKEEDGSAVPALAQWRLPAAMANGGTLLDGTVLCRVHVWLPSPPSSEVAPGLQDLTPTSRARYILWLVPPDPGDPNDKGVSIALTPFSQSSGGAWVPLGDRPYYLKPGLSYVELRNTTDDYTNKYVVADAVRFTRATEYENGEIYSSPAVWVERGFETVPVPAGAPDVVPTRLLDKGIYVGKVFPIQKPTLQGQTEQGSVDVGHVECVTGWFLDTLHVERNAAGEVNPGPRYVPAHQMHRWIYPYGVNQWADAYATSDMFVFRKQLDSNPLLANMGPIWGGVYSSPLISDQGILTDDKDAKWVFIGGADGQVYALGAETGELKWSGPGITLDEYHADVEGSEWTLVDQAPYYIPRGDAFFGQGYLKANATSKGDSSVVWKTPDRFRSDQPGYYKIYVFIPPRMLDGSGKLVRRAARATYTVEYDDPNSSKDPDEFVVTIDQNTEGWVALPAPRMGLGHTAFWNPKTVKLTNGSSSAGDFNPKTGIGYEIVADAIRIVPEVLGSFTYSSPVICRLPAVGEEKYGVFIGDTGGRLWKLDVRPVMSGADNTGWTRFSCWPKVRTEWSDDAEDEDDSPVSPIVCSPAVWDPGGGAVRRIVFGTTDPSGKSGRFYSVLADFDDPKPMMFPDVDDPNPQAVTSTPTIPDQGPLKNKAIFATMEGKIWSFDPNSGAARQIYPVPTTNDTAVGAFNYSSPAVRSNADGTDGRRLYVGSTDGKLYAFDVDSFGRLKKAWTKQDASGNTRIDAPANLLAPIQSSVAATANGQPGNPRPWLFTGTMDGKMWWVKDKGDQSDFVKQRAFWETEGSAVFSSPAVLTIGTNQWLFVGSNDGLVYGWSNAALPAGWADLGVEAYGSEGEAPTATDIGETERMPMANAWVDRDPADPDKKYYEDCGDWIEFDECPGYKVLESDSPACPYTKGLPPNEYGGVDWKTLKDKTPWLIPHKYSEAKLGNKLVGNVVRLEWGETLRLIAWNLSKDARDSRFVLTSTGEGQQAGSSYSYGANVTGQYNPYCPKLRPKEGDADWEDWKKEFLRLKNTCPTVWEKDPEKRWKHDLHAGKVFWRTCADPQNCEPPGVKPDCYPDPARPTATLKWDDFTKSFAKYAYVLDASSSAKPQTPGMSYTISFSYRGTKDVTEVSVDPNDPSKTKTTTKKMTYTATTVVPQPDDITAHPDDPSLWQPQSFAINNPLGINAGSGYSLGWDTSSGFNRGRSNTQNHMNGNGSTRIPLPLGDANHGLDSPQSSIGIMDRSYVGALLNLQIDKFRVRPSDLRWLGGPAAAEAANPLPTDILPPSDQTVANISPDYPDIPATKITFVKESDNANPAYFPTSLAPCNPPDDYRPIPDPLRTWVTVPKYQPPNVSGAPVGGMLTTIKGYGSTVYAYVDSNNNARPDIGLSILGRPITYSEAYREFTEGVTVLPDYKMKAQEETLDIGAVPHGFGMYNGFGPYNAGFAKWFRDITVHNIGNCNLKNLTVGRMPLYSQNVGMYDSDGDGYPDDANGTFPLSGQGISSSLYVGAPYNLKKPYPDGDPVLLQVKSPVDGKWYKPRISIAVPVSQPVGTYASRILVFADENKNDRWDWQISSYGASGGKPEAAADPSSTLLVRVRESRLTDGLTEGVLPQVDMPDKPLSGDISPAAFRAINPVDGTGLDLHLFWSSNRFQSAEPFPDDPWFIYYTRLPFVPNPMAVDPRLQWQPASANPPQWWYPVLPNNHIPPLAYQDEWKDGWPVMHDAKTDGLPGELIPRSVRHINPSVTQDPVTGQTWLFWQGQATKATADNNYFRENRVFYTDVTGGNIQNRVFSFTQDYTMVKYGPRGLAYREDPNDDPTKPASGAWLWVFWYGGDAGRFSIFYNLNRWNAGAQHDPTAWTQDVKVLTPSSLASVSDPIPVLRRIWNHEDRNKPKPETYIDLIYAGISKHGQSTDVYMTRYKPTVDSRGRVTLPFRKFPRVGTRDASDLPIWERLQRDPGSNVYYSRHISWSPPGESMLDVDRPIVTVVLPGRSTVFKVIDNDIKKSYDQATGTYAYTYPDGDPRNDLFGQVLLDMSAGTVRFTKPISPKALVRARYTPRALRLNTSGVLKLDKLDFPEAAVGDDLSWRWTASHASDGAPFAMLEKSPILNKADLWNAPPCGQNLTQPVPVDRYWVFWRRPQAEVRATTIFYKTMRLGVQLALPIAAEVGPDATGHWAKPIKITEILPDGSQRAFTGPFEAVLGDVAKSEGGRIYFSELDEYRTILGNVRDPQSDALRVRVEYTGVNPLNPSQTISAKEVSYVTWLDELPEQALLGDQTLDMVNEGQLCAVPDPPAKTCDRPSWMPTSVWLFWTSTRSGSADLYYETISPNFRPALWRR